MCDMATITQDLYATGPAPLPFAKSYDIRAFVLPRADGNLLVYSAPSVGDERDAIEERGGVVAQYLNHWHEAMFAPGSLDAPVLVHDDDRVQAAKHVRVDGTFTGPVRVGDDFQAIPIPGHTPGATAFLWDSGHRRYLFTGDSVYLSGGEWIAAVLGSSDREAYVDSLARLRDVEFDLLVPWAAPHGEPYMARTDARDARRRFDSIIRRLRAGEDS